MTALKCDVYDGTPCREGCPCHRTPTTAPLFQYDPARGIVHVCGGRVHHGMAGFVFLLLGLLLMFHDRKDFPWTTDD